MNPLRFEQSALLFEQCFPTCKLGLDCVNRLFQTRPRHDEMAFRINSEPVEHLVLIACQRIKRAELVYFVTPHFDTKPDAFVRRMDLNGIAANPKCSAFEV